MFREMSFLESIVHFFKTMKWVTVEVTYQILREGDEGFEDAPFESSVVFVGETLRIQSKHESTTHSR